MNKLRTLISTLLAIALAIGTPLGASATENPDPAIVNALQTIPGGQILDDRTAYWPDLQMTLTVPDPRVRDAIGTCPNGSICAYSGASLTGTRLSWTLCGTYSTAALGSAVRSIANATTTSKLYARNGTTIVATALAQSWASVTGASDNVTCG